MSEEEIEIIERIEDTFLYSDLDRRISKLQKLTIYEDGIKDIKKLLDLYNKEKEKNKELSEKVTQNICNRVEAEVLEEYRLKVQNSISKDKITELVFYYNKNALDIEQNNMFRPATSKEQIEIDTNRAIARAFKKLLEERN